MPHNENMRVFFNPLGFLLLRYKQVLHDQTPKQSIYFMFILVNKNNK